MNYEKSEDEDNQNEEHYKNISICVSWSGAKEAEVEREYEH